MQKYCVFLIMFILFLVGCSKISDRELFDKGDAAAKEGKYDESITYFEQLVQEHPKSMLVPEVLFYLSGLYKDQKKDYGKAIETLQRIVKEYPNYDKAANAQFLIGFIFHNDIHDLAHAKEAYEEFLKKYPSHELAQSAQFELENLGKDHSEIFPPKVAEKKDRNWKKH